MKSLIAVASIAVAWTAPASADPRCTTPERIATAPPVRAVRALALPAGGAKLQRNPFPASTHVRISDNFAVRWQDPTLTAAGADVVLDELERSYTLFTVDFGQAPVSGSDIYLINVYLSDPTTTPPIEGGGGYAGVDDEGFPHIVLSSSLLADEEGMRILIAHELYHDFQFSRGAFGDDTSRWYWEATAEWAAQERYTDNPRAFSFVGAYALAEEQPVFLMGPGDDPILGLHQYGAAVFPKYLTDTRLDRSIVIDTWEHGAPQDDAIDAILAQVAADPSEAADVYGEFAAHAVFWDMPHGDKIAPWVEAYADSFPAVHRFDAMIGAEGTDWRTVDAGHEVHAFGHDLIALDRPANGMLEIDLATDAAPVPVRWRATLGRHEAAGLTYTPIAITDGGTAHLTAALGPDEGRAWLVVAAIADTRDPATSFSFRFRIGVAPDPDPGPGPDPEPDPDPGVDPADSGGCAAGRDAGPGSLALLALAVVLVRAGRRKA